MVSRRCEECGAAIPADISSCSEIFDRLLYREWELLQEHPDLLANGVGETTHFFAVSSFILQHPIAMGYTNDALQEAKNNIVRVLNLEVTTYELRDEIRKASKKLRVIRKPEDEAPELRGTQWTITAIDVLNAPRETYPERVREWATGVVQVLSGERPQN